MSRELQFLVVDDEPTSRLELKKNLEEYGKVDEAESGVEAISIFRGAILNKTPFHFVTLDVAMPALDGMVTLECIRGLEVVHRSLPGTKNLDSHRHRAARRHRRLDAPRLGGLFGEAARRTRIEAKVREMFHLPLSPEQKAKLGAGPKGRPVPLRR